MVWQQYNIAALVSANDVQYAVCDQQNGVLFISIKAQIDPKKIQLWV